MERNLLRAHATQFEQFLRLVDPLCVVAAGLVAYVVYFGPAPLPEGYWLAIARGAFASVGVFGGAGLYRPQRGASLVVELRALFNAWLTLALAGAVVLFATKTGATYSRVWATLWVASGFAGHALVRSALRFTLRGLRRRGYNLRHIVIAGAGALGIEVATRLRNAPWSGLNIRAFYDDDTALAGCEVAGVPVQGTLDDLARDLARGDIDQVWISLPLTAEARLRDLLARLREHSVQICFVPDIYSFHLLHHSFSEVAGLPVIQLTDTPLREWRRVAKTVEDYMLSALIVLGTSPLLVAIAIGVKVSSPGPVFYRQERITWNGTRFQMLKFRSMPVGSETASGPVWARAGERRATRFGAFLRRTSLDELPQFFNVLKNEMSIVGPRPERPQFVDEFRKQIPGYMQKHLVKAGITGWAQVNDLRGDTDLAQRIQYDLYYIDNWSIWFDLRIMALTLVKIFRSRNAY